MNTSASSSATSHNTQTQTLIVRTVTSKTEKATAELDLHSLAENDLESLHENDPFMYYSIPAVREAELALKEVDLSKVLQSAHRSVTRDTRITFEKHSSLVMEELFSDEELYGADDSNLNGLFDIEDLFQNILSEEAQQ